MFDIKEDPLRPKQRDTRNRILDAAEVLFASDGPRGASLRAITRAAKANLAAVNYHFGSKEALLEAVLVRRLTPLNKIRRQRLETVLVSARLHGRRPEVSDILGAFIHPTLAFRDSHAGSHAFVSLIGRILTEPDGTGRSIFLGLMEPFLTMLFDLMVEALPNIPPDVLLTRIHFCIGALSHTMRNPHGPAPKQIQSPPTPDCLAAQLITFLSAGMAAPA